MHTRGHLSGRPSLVLLVCVERRAGDLIGGSYRRSSAPQLYRRQEAMGDADDAQDEEYRRQEWVSYYVEVNDFAAARSLGWEGPAEGEGGDAAAVATAAGASTGRGAPPSSRRPPPVGSEDAATRIQAHFRGHAAAATYKEERNEAARLQWISSTTR
ncbi:hypothetical protein T492DRAFT_845404 [Pavlovales sp. CCMP2436]|nr:hypothetical protein T492DRAFT_845404 [Pavlovales sp. CCMP2436]